MGKVLESLLAILGPDSEGARALDLFAGTGEVGMRLLDQGAKEVTFVEADAKVASVLGRRIRQSEHTAACRLLLGPIPKILERLQGRYSLLLADPPYDWTGSATLLPALAGAAEPEAILVVEHHHKTPYQETDGWVFYRQQKFGETRLSFFRLLVDPADHPGHDGDQSDEDSEGTGVVLVKADDVLGEHGPA